MDTSQLLKDFGKLLKNNHQESRSMFSDTETDCFRVYNWNIAEIPWMIDFYGKYLHISSLAENHHPEFLDAEPEFLDAAARMLYVPRERIFFKHRFVQGRELQHEKLNRAHQTLVVQEQGLKFKVNLADYLDTGLFLDHRISRQLVREAAAGNRILNLFAYTGAFTVYAAAGGAARTVSVDLSAPYLRWARENLELNGLAGDMHTFCNSDVREYLQAAVQRDERYELIILDPPTFSNSRKTEGTFDIQRDYVWFIGQCLKLLSKNGSILFSTNYHKFHFDPGRLRGAEVQETTRSTIPPDFNGKRRPHRSWVIRRR
ncbi:MAG: class I SAM-dependent methyltransferase [Spirochaetota bacterium]